MRPPSEGHTTDTRSGRIATPHIRCTSGPRLAANQPSFAGQRRCAGAPETPPPPNPRFHMVSDSNMSLRLAYLAVETSTRRRAPRACWLLLESERCYVVTRPYSIVRSHQSTPLRVASASCVPRG